MTLLLLKKLISKGIFTSLLYETPKHTSVSQLFKISLSELHIYRVIHTFLLAVYAKQASTFMPVVDMPSRSGSRAIVEKILYDIRVKSAFKALMRIFSQRALKMHF